MKHEVSGAHQSREERAKLPKVDPAPDWIAKAVESGLDFDRRISLLREKLLDGALVSATHLVQLFPKVAERVLKIDGELHPKTAWMVASLVFFRDPFGTFQLMHRLISEGQVCYATSGRDFFMQHREWVRSRGELGLLSTQSIGLAFRERPHWTKASTANVGNEQRGTPSKKRKP